MDTSAPATKADVGMIMDEMGKIHIRIHESEKRIIHHFSVVSEQNRSDMLSIHNDKISLIEDRTNNHEKRIKRLETHA